MSFFNTLFRSKRERSSDIARERLLKVLVDDRVKLTPDVLEQMKAELSAVVAKYVPGVEPDQVGPKSSSLSQEIKVIKEYGT